MGKRFLFICGVGRSGTTELARVVSAHEEIVLGIERYKRLWRPGRIAALRPQLFEREAFFNFDDMHTNITPAASSAFREHYEAMARKFGTASYVGDKLTRMWVPSLAHQFPGAKFIIIVRDVFELALSWEARAKNPSDKWPSDHGIRAAVAAWNAGLQEALTDAKTHPQSVLLIENRAFFSNRGGHQLDRLMRFLELEADAAITARYQAALDRAAELASKERTIALPDASFISRRARFGLWDKACALAASPLLQGANEATHDAPPT